jgi:predicted dehydrogenase
VSGLCQRSYLLDRNDDLIRMVHRPGGGIPFDMGGYYLHSFVNLFGPVEKASGFSHTVNENRKFLNPHNPRYGDDYKEPCINTISASLQFRSGVLGTLAIASESVNGGPQKIEVVGTEGTLFMHDPNNFFGPISVKKPYNSEALIIPYTHAFTEQDFRGLGVVDMAYAIKNNRKPRANADLGLHAFEIIHKIWESTITGQSFTLKHRAERPAAMPRTGLSSQCAEGLLDHN